MTPLTPAERDALRLRAEKADEVFSGRTVGELILDVREAHADASAGLLGAALEAILAQCVAEPFEPWPGSLVAALVAPEQLAEPRALSAVIELQKRSTVSTTSIGKKPRGRFTRQAWESERLATVRGLVASSTIREPPTPGLARRARHPRRANASP